MGVQGFTAWAVAFTREACYGFLRMGHVCAWSFGELLVLDMFCSGVYAPWIFRDGVGLI